MAPDPAWFAAEKEITFGGWVTVDRTGRPAYSLRIAGATHLSFMDVPFLPLAPGSPARPMLAATSIDPTRMRTVVSTLLVAFLAGDGHGRGPEVGAGRHHDRTATPTARRAGLSGPSVPDRTAATMPGWGSLRAVNVGLPKDVRVAAAAPCTPASGRRRSTGRSLVRRLNVDGDGQGDLGGHGGEHRAVFVYQLDSYRHWQQFLGRDDFTLRPVRGELHRRRPAGRRGVHRRPVPDRRGAVRGDPAAGHLLPGRASGWTTRGSRRCSCSTTGPGFYFRVLEEGEVRAGDEIVKVAAGPERMTVAEVDALLYLPGHPRTEIARALRIPALSPGWRASFQSILDQPESATGNAGLAAAAPPPAWPGFRPLRVTAIEPESTTVSSIRLADPDGRAGAGRPARPVPDRAAAARSGRAGVLRSYSLSGRPGADEYRISVKREPHGAGSGYLHARVSAGDTLEVAAPRGTFTLRSGTAPVLLISGGVGATPVLAMLHALAAARSDPRGLVAAGGPRTAPSGRSRRRRPRCSPRLPKAALPRLLQPARAGRRAGPRLRHRRPAVGGRAARGWTCRPTPRPTCAGRPDSSPTSPRPWSRSAWRRPGCTPRSSDRGPALTPGIARDAGPCRRTRRPARRATGPPCRSRAAT